MFLLIRRAESILREGVFFIIILQRDIWRRLQRWRREKEFLTVQKILLEKVSGHGFLLTHVSSELEDFVRDLLDQQGSRLQEFHQVGASVYLYDLSR